MWGRPRRTLDVVPAGEPAVAGEGWRLCPRRRGSARACVRSGGGVVGSRPGSRALDHPAVASRPPRGLDVLACAAVPDASAVEPSAQVDVGRTPCRHGARPGGVGVVGGSGWAGCRVRGPGPRPSRRRVPEIPSDRGSPLFHPVMGWIFGAALPRSAGFGPVSGPLLWPGHSRGRSRTATGPALLRAESVQDHAVEPGPDAVPAPLLGEAAVHRLPARAERRRQPRRQVRSEAATGVRGAGPATRNPVRPRGPFRRRPVPRPPARGRRSGTRRGVRVAGGSVRRGGGP